MPNRIDLKKPELISFAAPGRANVLRGRHGGAIA
jgi:hypothetical protein